jgi:hypothetical protein
VQSQEIERSCICVLGLSILPLSINFLLNLGPVPTVWHCFCSLYDQFICLS